MRVPGQSVAVVGGDRRMEEAVRCLLEEGVTVRTAALPYDRRAPLLEPCGTAAAALEGARLLLLPVQGISDQGEVYTQPTAPACTVSPHDLGAMAAGGAVFCGIANDYLRQTCLKADRRLVEYREADEFAIWNSIPSAEGAIQMAMEDSPFTLFGSRALVLGFGRTGRALATLLRGLNCGVTVAVRNELDYARVWASGCRFVRWTDLARAAGEVEFIFNTVPALILNREILQHVRPRAVIVDVASAPGGTDFEAARALGLQARLAPGLPGIVAPATAGWIIAGLILRHLARANGEEGERE